MLTRDMIERSLPPSLKSAATQELTDLVNQATSDPIVAEQIRDNFITYSVVLQEGKYKTKDYLKKVLGVDVPKAHHCNSDHDSTLVSPTGQEKGISTTLRFIE